MNDLGNCDLTSLDLIFFRLRPRSKKGLILKWVVFWSPVSIQLGAESFCQFWGAYFRWEGSWWWRLTGLEDCCTLPKRKQPHSPEISQVRPRREQVQRLPCSRWNSLPAAEKRSRTYIQQLMRFVSGVKKWRDSSPQKTSASQQKHKNTPALIWISLHLTPFFKSVICKVPPTEQRPDSLWV